MEINTYVTLSKAFLDKDTPAALKRFKDNFPNDNECGKSLFYDDEAAQTSSAEVEYDSAENKLKIIIDSELGYFNFEIPLSLRTEIEILEHIAKRVNKFKSVLESVK